MSILPTFTPEAARRVFDRAQATLVWLAVLAVVLPEPTARELVIAAMVAVALAASVVALIAPAARPPCPLAHPQPEESDDGLRP